MCGCPTLENSISTLTKIYFKSLDFGMQIEYPAFVYFCMYLMKTFSSPQTSLEENLQYNHLKTKLQMHNNIELNHFSKNTKLLSHPQTEARA